MTETDFVPFPEAAARIGCTVEDLQAGIRSADPFSPNGCPIEGVYAYELTGHRFAQHKRRMATSGSVADAHK